MHTWIPRSLTCVVAALNQRGAITSIFKTAFSSVYQKLKENTFKGLCVGGTFCVSARVLLRSIAPFLQSNFQFVLQADFGPKENETT